MPWVTLRCVAERNTSLPDSGLGLVQGRAGVRSMGAPRISDSSECFTGHGSEDSYSTVTHAAVLYS